MYLHDMHQRNLYLTRLSQWISHADVVTLPLTNYQENMAQTVVLPATSTAPVKKNRVFQYSNHGASLQAKQFEGRRPERDAEGLYAGTIRGFSTPSRHNNPPRIDII